MTDTNISPEEQAALDAAQAIHDRIAAADAEKAAALARYNLLRGAVVSNAEHVKQVSGDLAAIDRTLEEHTRQLAQILTTPDLFRNVANFSTPAMNIAALKAAGDVMRDYVARLQERQATATTDARAFATANNIPPDGLPPAAISTK